MCNATSVAQIIYNFKELTKTGIWEGELAVSGRLIGACAIVLSCMVSWGGFNPYLYVYLSVCFSFNH